MLFETSVAYSSIIASLKLWDLSAMIFWFVLFPVPAGSMQSSLSSQHRNKRSSLKMSFLFLFKAMFLVFPSCILCAFLQVACFGEDVYSAFQKALLATGFTFPKEGILIGIQVSPRSQSLERTNTEELSCFSLVFIHVALWLKCAFLHFILKCSVTVRNKHHGEIFTGFNKAGLVGFPSVSW